VTYGWLRTVQRVSFVGGHSFFSIHTPPQLQVQLLNTRVIARHWLSADHDSAPPVGEAILGGPILHMERGSTKHLHAVAVTKIWHADDGGRTISKTWRPFRRNEA
jgi:hypothetical protein